jgi:hypothetical protein
MYRHKLWQWLQQPVNPKDLAWGVLGCALWVTFVAILTINRNVNVGFNCFFISLFALVCMLQTIRVRITAPLLVAVVEPGTENIFPVAQVKFEPGDSRPIMLTITKGGPGDEAPFTVAVSRGETSDKT